MSETLRQLEEALTSRQLEIFLRWFAGTDVRFGKCEDGPSFAPIARVVGTDAARRLGDVFAGEKVYIPRSAADERAHRDADIRRRLAAGETARSIALTYRTVTTLSERHVRRIAASMGSKETKEREPTE